MSSPDALIAEAQACAYKCGQPANHHDHNPRSSRNFHHHFIAPDALESRPAGPGALRRLREKVAALPAVGGRFHADCFLRRDIFREIDAEIAPAEAASCLCEDHAEPHYHLDGKIWVDASSADEDWAAVGKPARTSSDATDWLPRCRKCGVPRGTLRHATLCISGGCDDPDAEPAASPQACVCRYEPMMSGKQHRQPSANCPVRPLAASPQAVAPPKELEDALDEPLDSRVDRFLRCNLNGTHKLQGPCCMIYAPALVQSMRNVLERAASPAPAMMNCEAAEIICRHLSHRHRQATCGPSEDAAEEILTRLTPTAAVSDEDINAVLMPCGHYLREEGCEAIRALFTTPAVDDAMVWGAVYAFNTIHHLRGDAEPHFRAMKAALEAAFTKTDVKP